LVVVVQEFWHPVAPLDQIQYSMRLLLRGEVLGGVIPLTKVVVQAALVVAVFGVAAVAVQAIRPQHLHHKAITVVRVLLRVQTMARAVVAEQGLLVLLALVLLAATGVMALHRQLQAHL
jgi:hypothetical protein